MDVWAKFLAGGEAVNLTATSQLEITTGTGITALQIAPDGAHVVVMARPTGSGAQFETWEIPAPLPGAARKFLDAREFGVHWSPDGRRITFIRAGGSAGDALFVADADGTNRKELIPARGGLHVHWPVWAQDGLIYFIHTFATILNLDQAEIFRIDSRGGAMEPVVSTSRRAMYPLPMPDGRGLVYAANPGSAELSLWWRPMRGGAPQRITMGVGEYAEPQISGDGRTMIATLYELRQSLNRIDLVGGRSPQLIRITDGFGGDLDPALSNAADQLAFTSSRSGNRNLWTASSDGAGARPLTSGSALDEQPAFSPDGSQLAFISDRGGRRAIWIVSAGGGTPRRVVDAPALGSVTWSADSRQLIYAAAGGDAWPALWTVTIATGDVKPFATPGAKAAVQPARCPTRDVIAFLEPPTETGITTPLGFVDSYGRRLYASLPPPPIGAGFANGTLAWAPDGRRLAVVSADTAQPTSVWIVDPDAAAPYRKLIDLPAGPRIRGVTWTRDGSAVIVGKHETSSHVVMLDQVK
jgi:Tol biopolymer transport system component